MVDYKNIEDTFFRAAISEFGKDKVKRNDHNDYSGDIIIFPNNETVIIIEVKHFSSKKSITFSDLIMFSGQADYARKKYDFKNSIFVLASNTKSPSEVTNFFTDSGIIVLEYSDKDIDGSISLAYKQIKNNILKTYQNHPSELIIITSKERMSLYTDRIISSFLRSGLDPWVVSYEESLEDQFTDKIKSANFVIIDIDRTTSKSFFIGGMSKYLNRRTVFISNEEISKELIGNQLFIRYSNEEDLGLIPSIIRGKKI